MTALGIIAICVGVELIYLCYLKGEVHRAWRKLRRR